MQAWQEKIYAPADTYLFLSLSGLTHKWILYNSLYVIMPIYQCTNGSKKEDTLKRGGYLPFSLETNQQGYINFRLMEAFFQKPTHI